MRRLLLLVAACGLTATMAAAQGVAPGGGFYNSTGIGSGLGGVVGGTGPIYPNGTTAPATPRAIPPGGLPPLGRIDTAPAPYQPPAIASPTTMPRSPYPQPTDPYGPVTPRRKPVTVDVAKDSSDKAKNDDVPPATQL